MTTDPTTMALVHTIAGADDVTVERDHLYSTDQGPLGFDLYRARGAAPSPAIVFVTGYPDPGMAATFRKPIRAWVSYAGWARSMAASGITGVVYENRRPSDVLPLVDHLRANAAALGLDPTRIGVWACSGHVPNALALLAQRPLACAALLYGYLIDFDGATGVAAAAAQFHFAAPPVTLDELPRELPLLVVRAGRDAMPGLDAGLHAFVAAAGARGMAVTLIDHVEAPHAFDLVDASPRTREVIEEVVAFVRRGLAVRSPHAP